MSRILNAIDNANSAVILSTAFVAAFIAAVALVNGVDWFAAYVSSIH